jgi:predicted transcriptional regulator
VIRTSSDLVAHLLGVGRSHSHSPEQLLRELGDGAESSQQLGDRLQISRASVHRALDPLVDEKILFNQDGQFTLTGSADVYLRVIEETVSAPDVSRSALRFLFGSPARLPLLRSFQAKPASKSELAHGDEAPSKTTVYRNFSKFEERGWVTSDQTGHFQLTDTGQRVLSSVETLLERTEIVMDRAELLYGCREVADIPVEALANAELYVDTPDTPHSTSGVLRKLADPNLDSMYGFCSVVSYEYADAWDPVIRSGTQIEIIVTEQVLRSLPTEGPYTEHVRRGLNAENFGMLVEPELEYLPIGLAIINDEMIMVGTPHEYATGNHVHMAAGVSDDPDLVAWGKEMYDRYREHARPPGTHVIKRLKQKVGESVSSSLPDRLGRGNCN